METIEKPEIVVVCRVGFEKAAKLASIDTVRLLSTENPTLKTNQIAIVSVDLENQIDKIDFQNAQSIERYPMPKEFKIQEIKFEDPKTYFKNRQKEYHRYRSEQLKYRSSRLSKQTTLKHR
jgi:NAD+--asparagine ADP-ribosyltransferase